MQIDTDTLSRRLFPYAVQAGAEILNHFGGGGAVRQKPDGTPATDADVAAEAIIVKGLSHVAPGVPIVAEEAQSSGTIVDPGGTFFLVDPLDGTREFIAGRREFTVNIGLVVDDIPVFGLIYAPALGEFYATLPGGRCCKALVDCRGDLVDFDDLDLKDLHTRKPSANLLAVVTSRSHPNRQLEAWLKRNSMMSVRTRMGSSLKFCAIAEGSVDIYPRFGRTMEWDTAAGHAIVNAAGGQVGLMDGSPMAYGKREAGYANTSFFACGMQETFGSIVNT